MRHRFGFTLIELLVVIVIIGVLASLAVIAVNSSRAKARDAKRVSDLKQISTALELYYADYSSYPNIITPGQPLTSPDGTKTYMSKVPNNPTPWAEDACTSGSDYVYNPVGGLTNPPSYNISGCLAKGTGSMTAGEVAMTPSGLNSVACPARICGDCSTTACGSTCTTNITNTGTSTAESYPTVQIGTQCWMTKNITNVGTMTTGVVYSDDSLVERACYSDSQANCNTDGALYAWNEAMYLPASATTTQFTAYTGSGATAKHQGICPVGWHIPSDREFALLEDYLDTTDIPPVGDGATCTAATTWGYNADLMCSESLVTRNSSTPYGIDAGTYLKANNSLWVSNTGTNISGFTALPAGSGLAGVFSYRGTYALFWSSSQNSVTNAWRHYLGSSESGVTRYHYSKVRGLSVRCLKD